MHDQPTATRRRPLNALRNENGVVDLASVMTGVIILAIVTAAATASVLIAIPYAQDRSARGTLDGVRTAESVAAVRDGRYEDLETLVAQKRITAQPNTKAGTGLNRSCFVAYAKSASGTTFYITSKNDNVQSNKSGTVDTSWCVTLPAPGA